MRNEHGVINAYLSTEFQVCTSDTLRRAGATGAECVGFRLLWGVDSHAILVGDLRKTDKGVSVSRL